MPEVVDPRMLMRLAALPGADGRNLATELVDSYLVQAPRSLEQLVEAAAASDTALLRHRAHSLRGSALMLGANVFAEHLHGVELSAERGEPEAATEALAIAAAAWPATAVALSAATAAWRDGSRAT